MWTHLIAKSLAYAPWPAEDSCTKTNVKPVNNTIAIEKYFTHLDAAKTNVSNTSDKVTVALQSMLAEAFASQLVAQDPNDEPASLLLERITAAAKFNTPLLKLRI